MIVFIVQLIGISKTEKGSHLYIRLLKSSLYAFILTLVLGFPYMGVWFALGIIFGVLFA